MEKEERERQESKKRPFWFRLIDVLMTIISGVGIIIATLAEQGTAEIKDKIFLYIGILLGFALLVFLMTILVALLRKRSAKASAIKRQLVSAFSDAVDASFLNPKRDNE